MIDSLSSERIALWYYFRWQVESYFKLMKSGSQELEYWEQETAGAIFNRLLIAGLSSGIVWRLQRMEDGAAKEFKGRLVQMSGKSYRRDRAFPAGLLLSGLYVLFRMFDLLDSLKNDPIEIENLRKMLHQFVPIYKKDV